MSDQDSLGAPETNGEAPELSHAVDVVSDQLAATIERLKMLRAEKEALRLEIKRTVRAVELLERMARVTR